MFMGSLSQDTARSGGSDVLEDAEEDELGVAMIGEGFDEEESDDDGSGGATSFEDAGAGSCACIDDVTRSNITQRPQIRCMRSPSSRLLLAYPCALNLRW